MKRRVDWKHQAAIQQRIVAALVYKIGGECVNITEEDLKQAVEKGIEIANLDGVLSLRVPVRHQSRIVAP